MHTNQTTTADHYINIARSSEVFRQIELETINELLCDCRNNPATTYEIMEEKNEDKLCGFIIFGKTPLTDYCWDIYWLVVERQLQRKNIGKRLLAMAQDHILSKTGKAILRVETSEGNKYSSARNFYLKEGFKESGKIPDFYSPGCGLIIYSKHIEHKGVEGI